MLELLHGPAHPAGPAELLQVGGVFGFQAEHLPKPRPVFALARHEMSDTFAAWVPSFQKPVTQDCQRGLVSLTDRSQEGAEFAVLGMVTVELALKTGRVTHLASPGANDLFAGPASNYPSLERYGFGNSAPATNRSLPNLHTAGGPTARTTNRGRC
jgi:hypothetical protein